LWLVAEQVALAFMAGAAEQVVLKRVLDKALRQGRHTPSLLVLVGRHLDLKQLEPDLELIRQLDRQRQ